MHTATSEAPANIKATVTAEQKVVTEARHAKFASDEEFKGTKIGKISHSFTVPFNTAVATVSQSFEEKMSMNGPLQG